jgi:hypothetical protein
MTKFLCIFVLALSLFLCTGHVYGHSEASRLGSGTGEVATGVWVLVEVAMASTILEGL